MSAQEIIVLTGRIVEDDAELGLDELCAICAVERQWVMELVEHGVIESRTTQLRFSSNALGRVRIALRLQRDLGVNPAGAALALELMARIEELERTQMPAYQE
ncbi:MAG: chaperone modulator CbpM [Steroidobacteraceae bacterium]